EVGHALAEVVHHVHRRMLAHLPNGDEVGQDEGSTTTRRAPVDLSEATRNASAASSIGKRWVTSASTRWGVDASRLAASSKSRPCACRQYPSVGTVRSSFMKHCSCGQSVSGPNTPSTPIEPPGAAS